MYVTINDRQLDLFKKNGQIVRRFETQAKIMNAQIAGNDENATISISMEGGKFAIYKANGQLIRQG